jgi:hypothetical protein
MAAFFCASFTAEFRVRICFCAKQSLKSHRSENHTMRYCPECGERFDEDIIKFCTKDGTPLVEEEEPKFTAMPSQSGEETDDIGEETVIRRKPFEATSPETTPERERFVISTGEPPPQQVRSRPSQAYYPPPPPPQNTGKVVVLTILGTILVLACGAGLFWLLQKNEPTNSNNINTNLPNLNMNLNTNLGFDSNFNFNNLNTNFNMSLPNLNVNLSRPTPTPRPSLPPRPSPVASPMPFPSPRVTTPPSATPRIGPRPPSLSRPPGNGN